MSDLTKLQKLALERGLSLKDCGSGHIQIIGGPLLVNYWPDSKKRTAYVAGTSSGHRSATPEQAISMALTPPAVQTHGTHRKGNYKREKLRRLAKRATCLWCGCGLSIDGHAPGTHKATLEHVIPLKRGGLDNANNRDIACGKCNQERGHNMPEIQFP